jgi:phosphoribosylglycinamide formyltransferase-1
MKRLGILLSGRGSNFVAIAEAIAQGRIEAEIALVISNRPDAGGLAAARERGIETLALPSKGVARETYDQQLIAALRAARVDLVCLPGFIQAFPQRILNIHPSLLPAFPGLDAQHQALDHGVKVAGCTVHFVDEGLDSGPIVMQAAVPVLDEDTYASLAARILVEEHKLYAQAIALVVSGAYRIEGRRVIRTAVH